MEKKSALFLLSIILLIGLVVAVPSVLFEMQIPVDIDSFNLFGFNLNITYNISDANLNVSTIFLYYKINSSINELNYYINGTITSGYQSIIYNSNTSSMFLFRLFDNNVYPATYNFPERAMELENKSVWDLDGGGEYLKINFLNVSNQTRYNIFEIYAKNQTANSNTLRIYYCNSSHTTQNPANSNSCTNFYNLDASVSFNHSHSVNSFHHTIPMAINTTLGRIGNVVVTSSSSVLVRGRTGTNAWNIYYIVNISRPNTIQRGTNSGTVWANFSGTVDAHLHQYYGDEALNYYICANDTSGAQNCSTIRTDLITLGGLAPSSPNLYNPINQSYRLNLIINYTPALSPNLYGISHYNLTLTNFTDNYVLTILANNSLNLSYVFDTTLVDDGVYNIHVEACDINGLCSIGESDDFTIDNTNPTISSISSSPSLNSVSIFYTANESTNYTLYYGSTVPLSSIISSSAKSISQVISLTELTASTIYYYNLSVCDEAGNCNASSQYSFTTSQESQSSGSSTSGLKYPILYVTEEQLRNIFSKILSKDSVIIFNFKNQSHKIKINEITDKETIFTLYSEPRQFIINLSNESKIDIDEDGYYDISIKLNSIENKKANIEIKLITDKISGEKIIVGENIAEDTQQNPEINRRGNYFVLGLIILLIFILLKILLKKLWKNHRINQIRFTRKKRK